MTLFFILLVEKLKILLEPLSDALPWHVATSYRVISIEIHRDLIVYNTMEIFIFNQLQCIRIDMYFFF